MRWSSGHGPGAGFDRWRRRASDWWLARFGLHMSLGIKLAVPVLATTAVLAGVMGVIVTNQVKYQVEQAYDQQAEAVAAGAAAMYLQHPSDTVQVNDYLQRLVRSRSDLRSIRIMSLDASTSVIASSDPAEVGRGGLADQAQMKAIWGGYPLEANANGPSLITVHPLKAGDILFGAVII